MEVQERSIAAKEGDHGVAGCFIFLQRSLSNHGYALSTDLSLSMAGTCARSCESLQVERKATASCADVQKPSALHSYKALRMAVSARAGSTG
eukprot:1158964-Pelagomonas_calceolata.AAC.2